MRTAEQIAATLVIQYVAPQMRKAGLELRWLDPDGVRWLTLLLESGEIDMKTARASIIYQVNAAGQLAEFAQHVIQTARDGFPPTAKVHDGQDG